MRSVRISLFCVLLAGVASQSAQSADFGVVRASDQSDKTSAGPAFSESSGAALGVVRTSDGSNPRSDGTGYFEGSDPALGVIRIASQPEPVADEPVYYEDINPVTFDTPGLFDEEYVIFRRDQGDGRGYDNGFTSLGFFTPIFRLGPDQLLFNNSMLNFTEHGSLSTNIGVGGRRMLDSGNRIVGVSTWFDSDKSDTGNRYEQLGIAFELLGENWDLRGSFSNPISHGTNSLGTVFGTTPFFKTNQILFSDIALGEQALTSADIEFGVRLPDHPWIKVYAGPYWYDSETRTDKWGLRGRIVADLSDAATAQVSLSNDPLFGTTLNFAVSYAIGTTWQPLRPYRKKTLRERMFEQVARIHRIPSRVFISSRFETPAINARTNLPYVVAHVDNSNPAGPGDGTFENPFTSLTPSGPTGADLIVVRRGTTSRTTLLTGGTVLTDNQRLLGEGVPHTFIAQFRGTFLLPGVATSGQLPFATAPNGTNVVTLRNNNEVSGLNLISPLNGNAIGGTGFSNFNINNINNDINLAGINSGDGAGIVLQNVSGIGTIDNVRFNSTQAGSAGGIVVQNTGTDPFTLNLSNVPFSQGGMNGVRIVADNSRIIANLTNVTASNTGDGVRLSAQNAGAITATIRESTFNDSTGSGIAANVSGANSNINLTVSNVVAQGNGRDGIEIVAETGGAFQAVLENSSLNLNDRNAIRAVLIGGSTGMLTVTNTTGTGSGQHGIFLSLTGGSILNTSTLTGVDVSNSGRRLVSADLRDAVNIVVSGMGSVATVNLTNVTGVNTVGNTSQFNGLRQIINLNGRLTTVVSGSNFSLNQMNGIITQARSAGNADLTVTGTTANGNLVDGFLFDNDAGIFTANVTTSSFNSNGQNAIRGISGGLNAMTNVTFNSTTANASLGDGVFLSVNGGTDPNVFNFTYLATSPSAIINSGGFAANLTLMGNGMTTGTIDFTGVLPNGAINVNGGNPTGIIILPTP
jgi:hypothetical protein